MTNLAVAIHSYRLHTKKSQRDLADELDLSEAAISRLLSGMTLPDGPTLVRILNWLMEEVKTNGE